MYLFCNMFILPHVLAQFLKVCIPFTCYRFILTETMCLQTYLPGLWAPRGPQGAPVNSGLGDPSNYLWQFRKALRGRKQA